MLSTPASPLRFPRLLLTGAAGYLGRELRPRLKTYCDVLRLSDINGPRGGRDKRCRIQVPFPGTRNVVIEDTEADLYVAIDRAAERAERAVVRRLERLREFPHARLAGREAPEADAVRDAVAAMGTD